MSQHSEKTETTERRRRELTDLWHTLSGNAHRATRRDVLRWSAIVAGAAATAGATAGRGSAAARGVNVQDQPTEQDAEIAVPFDAFGQPVTLDPHRSVDYGGFWVMFPNVWNGLLRYDELGRVIEDLAESYAVSDDGLVYTFKIRPDATYANGRQVIAADFVSSWQRALDPASPSPMATFMQHVAGYQQWLDEEQNAALGFNAVDDSTVEVTLSQPASFFPSYMASFVWSVVDPQVLEEAGDDEFVLRDAGTGPWRFTEFAPDQQFVMERNEGHYAGTSPSIAKMTWPILTGPSAAADALERYRSDEVVSADVPLSLKQTVEDDVVLSPELNRIEPSGHVRSLAMDFAQPPFDDVRVRRAFALAIDRDRFSELYEGTWTPTLSFTPPVVAELSEYQPPEGLAFDADEASRLLEEAGYPNGEGLAEIIYYHPSGDSAAELDRVRGFLQMFTDTLGVEITLDDTKTLEQITDLQGDNGGRQFDLMWWQTVTDTPHLLAEVFHSTSPYMEGAFNWNSDIEASGDFDPGADSTAFDDLVTRADIERDQQTRNDLYRQAEELVLKNAVYVPIANWVPMYLQKPWLSGTKQGPWTGRLPVRFDKDVVVLQRDEG